MRRLDAAFFLLTHPDLGYDEPTGGPFMNPLPVALDSALKYFSSRETSA